MIHDLAEELLRKESITLPDILRILGDRPFPLKESVREYLVELEDRKTKADNAEAEATANAAANTPTEES